MRGGDPVDEFIDAGTEYVLALVDARTSSPPQRLNSRIIDSKTVLRTKLLHLLKLTDAEPFYCARAEHGGIHCITDGWGQCPACAAEDDKPCDYETFSGECMECGARLGEPCELGWEE